MRRLSGSICTVSSQIVGIPMKYGDLMSLDEESRRCFHCVRAQIRSLAKFFVLPSTMNRKKM